MGEAESQTQSHGAAKYPIKPLVVLILGVAMVFIGALLAERIHLWESLQRSLSGESEWEQIEGSAERLEDGRLRIRYTHPNGGIYTRTVEAEWLTSGVESGEVVVLYDPEDPDDFRLQTPLMLWGVAAFILLVGGLVLVLYARRMMRTFFLQRAQSSRHKAP
jgi:hypothetical protein